MSYQNQEEGISFNERLRLEAVALFWQMDSSLISKLDTFVIEQFNYPKGGGWDLDSLWENFLLDFDLTLSNENSKWLPQAIAESNNESFQPSNSLRLIEKEVRNRYQPTIKDDVDLLAIKNLSVLFMAMEAVRLSLLDSMISATTLPSDLIAFFDNL